jgi:DNA-binding CsgD family transcriptional regulator/tetratricopeptide (TPR) repeat protein
MGVDLRLGGGPGTGTGPPSFSSVTAGAILAGMEQATGLPFVGRVPELGRLTAVLDRAERGRPAVALVAGDAGVGKTRLLAQLAGSARERGVRVLVGGCMEVGDVGLPYVPFVDAFRDLGARPGEAELSGPLLATAPSLGHLLPGATRPEHDPAAPPGDGFERVQLFDGVLSLLVRLSELAPVLLVVEDLHWADRSTRDLLAFLVRTLRTGRIGLVASYRSDELHRRHPLRPLLAELVRVPDLERLEVRPFNREELAEYLEALAGAQVPGAVVDRILARSEGNAFFTEELVAAGAVGTEVALPDALADVLLGRVEALSGLAQDVLKVVAVAGRSVGHHLLVAAAGRPEAEVERGLREAIAVQVLVADPATEGYRFRHALLQEVVYGDLLPGERTRLHATYARLLAAGPAAGPSGGSAAELAYHSLASHDLPGALATLVRAAADATAVSAPAEAFGHLTQALELWARVPDAATVAGLDRAGLLLRAADAASDSGEWRHALRLGREAVDAIDAGAEPLRAAVALDRLGWHLLVADADDEEMVAACRRAVELVPAEPPTPLRARVTAGLATVLLHTRRDEDEVRRLCAEALAVARASGSASDESHVLSDMAVLEKRHDRLDSARSLFADAHRRAADTGDRALELRAQTQLGTLEHDAGDLDAARAALDEAAALAERSGLSWSVFGSDARVLRCVVRYQAGAWDEAERLAVAVDDRSPATGSLSAAALYVEVGRGLARAHERLARLEPLMDDSWVAHLAGGCAIDLACWEGELDRCRQLTRARLERLAAEGEAWTLSLIWPAALGLAAEADRAGRDRTAGDEAELADALGVGAELLERARASERRARALGRHVGPEALAWLARAEAEWNRLEGRADPDRWAAAADAFGYGYRYEEARSRWRLAEALLALGRRDDALAPARSAHAVAASLGARPLRAEVEALARRARLDLGAGVAPTGGAAGLTPRELEVLRLVAGGRSNRQIAQALFISPKTASVHVSNIMAKLGVHTRVEAAAVAHRLGLGLDGSAPSRAAVAPPEGG